MSVIFRQAITVVFLFLVSTVAAKAQSPTARACNSVLFTRQGNIQQGICYARSGLVPNGREAINRTCEQLIQCGGPNDRNDCHLARNVCKGVADPVCDHSGFDVFAGPMIKNASCAAVQNRCSALAGEDRRVCEEVAAELPTATALAQRATPAPERTPPPVRFRNPVEDPGMIESAYTSEPWNLLKGPFLVDHDPATREGGRGASCVDYMGRGGLIGAPWCYGGHTGSDFILIGGFKQMDVPNTNWVAAAADGVVETVQDSLYDRCHLAAVTLEGLLFNIDCDKQIDGGPSGGNFAANVVTVRHAGDVRTSYFHIAKSSALVRPGDQVRCGQRIARIGSSGISSFPHLHFEVRMLDGRLIDPYAGPRSQPESWWVDQGPDNRRIPAARCS